jgi:hypothetical protein
VKRSVEKDKETVNACRDKTKRRELHRRGRSKAKRGCRWEKAGRRGRKSKREEKREDCKYENTTNKHPNLRTFLADLGLAISTHSPQSPSIIGLSCAQSAKEGWAEEGGEGLSASEESGVREEDGSHVTYVSSKRDPREGSEKKLVSVGSREEQDEASRRSLSGWFASDGGLERERVNRKVREGEERGKLLTASSEESL